MTELNYIIYKEIDCTKRIPVNVFLGFKNMLKNQLNQKPSE
jgi:hypothetical protein